MGFSLIELSIVILVIGILVIGITKGSAIMTKAKIGSARALTNGSPVLQISDLFVWYEPVLDSSFPASNAFEGTTITSWNDNNPSKSSQNNAATVVGAPTYRESSINSLPVVRFPGGTSSLGFNSLGLNQKDYTIFVVEQRTSATSATVGRFLNLGGTSGSNALGYATATTITMPGSGTQTVTAYASPIPRIITFLSNSTAYAANSGASTKGVFINGGAGNIAGGASAQSADTLITANATGYIGRDTSATASYYVGDISEIIIFTRALKLDERNDIQNYLSKKYGIKVTQSS